MIKSNNIKMDKLAKYLDAIRLVTQLTENPEMCLVCTKPVFEALKQLSADASQQAYEYNYGINSINGIEVFIDEKYLREKSNDNDAAYMQKEEYLKFALTP